MSILPPSPRRLAHIAVLGVFCLSACAEDGTLFGSSNHPPRADAGADRQVAVGDTVHLDGANSDDPDGDPIEYAWDLVSGPQWVGIDSAHAASASVLLPVEGGFLFRLTVIDESGASDRAQVRIVAVAVPVVEVNHPPQADAGSDRALSVGEELVLDGSISFDADGDSLSYFWVQVEGPGVAIRGADQPRASVEFDEPGDYLFRLVVIDDHGGSSSDLAAVTVTGVTDPPNQVPEADAGPSTHVFAGDTVTLDGSASRDADGDELSFSWVQMSGPQAVAIDGSTEPTATVTPPEAGTYVFRLTVADGQAFAEAQVRVVVSERVGNIQVEGVFEAEDG